MLQDKVSPDYEEVAGTHKAEILATRVGGFGSSDAAMIIDIATIGKVMPKHYKRLAIFEGLIEPDTFSTPAMETGNQREQEIFNYYKEKYVSDEWENNPMYTDIKNVFSNEFKCFSHIDIVQKTKAGLHYIYEIKTSKDSIDLLKIRHDAQLKWHCILANDDSITLIHYKEKHDGSSFDSGNVVLDGIYYSVDELQLFIVKIKQGLLLIKDFLTIQKDNDYADLREHCKERNAMITLESDLPESILKKIQRFENYMIKQKQEEKEFIQVKEIILKTMSDKHIDRWALNRLKFAYMGAGISNNFDTTKFKNDHPDLYRQYVKESPRKEYLKITLTGGGANA